MSFYNILILEREADIHLFQPSLPASGAAACWCRSSHAEAFTLLNHFHHSPAFSFKSTVRVKDSDVQTSSAYLPSVTPILVFIHRREHFFPSLFTGAAVRWIWLVLNKSPRRGLFSGNKQSLPFPLGEVLKSMPVPPTPPALYLSLAHTSGLWCWVLLVSHRSVWVWAITSWLCIIDGLSAVQRVSLPHFSAQSEKKTTLHPSTQPKPGTETSAFQFAER